MDEVENTKQVILDHREVNTNREQVKMERAKYFEHW